MWLLDFLSYRYIYALVQLFLISVLPIIFIPIVVIYMYLKTFFVIL